jgi:hypothetical protein
MATVRTHRLAFVRQFFTGRAPVHIMDRIYH